MRDKKRSIRQKVEDGQVGRNYSLLTYQVISLTFGLKVIWILYCHNTWLQSKLVGHKMQVENYRMKEPDNYRMNSLKSLWNQILNLAQRNKGPPIDQYWRIMDSSSWEEEPEDGLMVGERQESPWEGMSQEDNIVRSIQGKFYDGKIIKS